MRNMYIKHPVEICFKKVVKLCTIWQNLTLQTYFLKKLTKCDHNERYTLFSHLVFQAGLTTAPYTFLTVKAVDKGKQLLTFTLTEST